MKKITMLALLCIAVCAAGAQNLKLKGIGHNNRYDDGDQMKTQYLGWNSELQKAIFIVDQGIYAMSWDGTTVTTPQKEPPVVSSEVKGDPQKELWANNFNMMYGNSGAAYVAGRLVTITSRDEQSTTDEQLFSVRKWDAQTGDLISTETRTKSSCLESAGMAYNPVDGKTYGLFYLTGNDLPEEITSDPDYFADDDDDMTDGDAGYAICTIDLKSMKVTPVTPGLYYENFVTFAINSEGRAFALTSGGTNGVEDEDGRMRNINGELTGAQLCEFSLKTGLMLTKSATATDPSTGETYTEQVPLVGATGYCSQYKRQAACFAKSNPGKMYWVGYYNSGKGINEWGSWSTLSDKEWRTNGKYDTALYEVDINTGEATRLAKIPNRWTFSCLWVEGDDASDDAETDPFSGEGTQPTEGTYIALQHADNGSIWQQVETGKQYTYYIEPAEGWTIHSVTFNGTELTPEDNTVTTPAVSAALSRLIVTFEKNEATDIDQARAASTQARVLASANGVHITNANDGDLLTIATIDGKEVRSMRMKGTQADVSLKAGEVYIIKVAGKVVKVRL